VTGADLPGLCSLISLLIGKARIKSDRKREIIVIQEADLDGFADSTGFFENGVASQLVATASLQVSRRRRRAKTDRRDGAKLLHTDGLQAA